MQSGLFVPLCSSRKLTAKFDIQLEGLRGKQTGGNTGGLVRNNDPIGLDQAQASLMAYRSKVLSQ